MTTWIERLGRHRIAANGMMILVILLGLWSLQNINRQFFPDFEIEVFIVNASWPGASAEDIQEALGIPLENSVITIPELESIRTTSSENSLRMSLRIERGADLDKTKQAIEDAIATVQLPEEVESPQVRQIVRYEPITDLLVYGQVPLEQLIGVARDYADQLASDGIAQVRISGSPSEQFQIIVGAETLLDLEMTLDQFGNAINSQNRNLPAGIAGSNDVATQLRAQGQARDVESLQNLPVLTDTETGAQVKVGDVAEVIRKFTDDYQYITYNGMPAINLDLRRQVGEDTLKTAEIYRDWLEKTEPKLPEGVYLHPYNEQWRFLESRIGLILENGIMGMMLVLIILFVFLNTRIAWWVALGIPVSFMATFLFMEISQITINAFSLFGFMIAVGIIVDDAIVVSEDAQVLQTQGMKPMDAAIHAAKRMWPPVMASSLTTIAAFMPLLLLGGRLGELLVNIPAVVVCAIVASLVECFLILPGHLGHSARSIAETKPSRFREFIDRNYRKLRDDWFRPFATHAIEYRWATLAVVTLCFLWAIGLVTSNRIKVFLPPQVEGTGMQVSVDFAEGTDERQINDFLFYMVDRLKSVEEDTGYSFIKTLVITHRDNDEVESASISVELKSDTSRPYSNQQLVQKWRQATQMPAGVEKISFGRSWRGLSNADVTIRLKSDDVDRLKDASLALQAQLGDYQGVSDMKDDLPFGTEQWRFTLTSEARTLGLDLVTLASRMQSMLDGRKISFVQEEGEELDIRVSLPAEQRNNLAMMDALPISLGNGQWAPLASLMDVQIRRGVDSLTRQDGELSVVVTADVDDNVANANDVLSSVEQSILPELSQEYRVSAEVEGNRDDEQRVLSDMKFGVVLAFILIFGILAWVFESWLWPFAVLAAIPFGLTGALLGHWLMGINVSMLSLFGLFGLSGIVINDSIVLISFYQRLRNEGLGVQEAAIEAACQRLRPVLLTSITTIAGLTPLLFESSFDAQFLIPMAVVIVFGLLFGTVLILLLVPGLLLSIENGKAMFHSWRNRADPAERH